MQVKAQGLLNAAKWIEEEYGRTSLGEVVRACSEPVRERYIAAIAINWHPVEEFIEFVETADRILGKGNRKLAEEIGAAGARANMKGTLVRIAFYVAQPEFFFRRVAGLWRQFNDEGQMLVHSLDARKGVIEVSGLSKPNATFCAVLSGWTRQVSMGIGIENPTVRHAECRTRGDARCMWEARWTAMETDEKKVAIEESANRLRVRASSPPSSGQLPGVPSSGAIPSSGRLPSSARVSATEALPSSAARRPSGRPKGESK